MVEQLEHLTLQVAPAAPQEGGTSSFPWPAHHPAAVDESYVLPVLARFNGMPEVDDAGQIQYVFPDLQQTATVSKGAPSMLAAEVAAGQALRAAHAALQVCIAPSRRRPAAACPYSVL